MVVDANQIAPESLYRLARSEYDKMVEMGVFVDRRIELLGGILIKMSPQGAQHAEATARLFRFLVQKLGIRAIVRAHSPLAVAGDSEPEPDISVVPAGDYWDAHPTKAFLVVEVADSSLNKERQLKTKLYAQADIPEYWIVNLVDGLIEVHTSPQQGIYQNTTQYTRADTFALVIFSDVSVAAKDFLPA